MRFDPSNGHACWLDYSVRATFFPLVNSFSGVRVSRFTSARPPPYKGPP